MPSMTEGDFLVLKETLGISWAELARRLGVSNRQLYRYRDGSQITPEKVQLAAEGLICREVHQKRAREGAPYARSNIRKG